MTNGEFVKDMTSKFDKLAKFEGQDFLRWQKKMHFLLTILKVVYVLSTPSPVWSENKTLETTRKRIKWEKDDYICRGHILNEDASATKFLELDNNPKGKNQIGSSSVNMVEEDGAKNSNNNKNKRKCKSGDDKFANKKGTITCWKCKKTGHMKKDCRSRKGNDGAGSNGSKDLEKQQGYNSYFMQNFYNVLHYVSVISDAFYVQDDEVAWWVDSGATSHVCKDLRWFQVCKSIEYGSFVKMGNIANEPIKGIGRVLLTFSSGKTLCLDNVLYVPGTQKNLVSKIVLNKCGYKQVLESDKYILSRHGSFVRFGYVCNGMIRLNLNYPLFNASTYMITSSHSNSLSKSELWHARLGHVHYKIMRDMSKMSLIPDFDMTHESCKTCMLTKITRQPFMGVNRESIVLDLIHSDLCDFHANTSLGHNKPRGMIQPSSSKIAEDEVEGTDDVHDPSVPRKSTRTRKAKSFGSDFQLYLVEGTRDKTLSQRFRQKEGIDFFDTYAHVARISTIRLLLALAAIHDLVIHQMDVKTAFLNGDLDEEIYMKQPEGFVMHGHESKVCKLKKSLYGMKQASKQWHQKFDEVVLSSDFSLNQADKCVYRNFDASGKGLIICLYVDDMLILCTDQDQVNKTKELLSSKFDMKDLREAEVILGIRIKRGNNGGWVFLLRGGAISWASKKQTCITSSTMEFEFVALAATGNEAEWMRNLVYEIPLWPKPISTISIKCISAATLAKAYSQVYNGKSRHLGVRQSMIHELIMNGVISVEFVRTQLNLADHLTKGLARDPVRKAAIGMGLKST
nr:zinc finger, CCHC-type [Tanacetum cinerariifolium]